jgi:ParB family chromosome partitioning protein
MAAPKKTASPKPQHRDIPFAQLHFTGTYNVRKMSSAPIEPLAATIARRGLLQNLIVVEDPKGRFDIAAGRRRFLAVGHNVETGAMPADVKLRCLVVDAADALELSLIENIEREAMNPAEEALAFAALVDDGMDIATVAASFGVTERHVRARQRLGRLAPPVMEAFAARDLSIEQAQAFAVVDDQARQAAVFAAWSQAPGWERSAASIRRMMTETRLGSRHKLARLVGREAYAAAGGTVTEDLFGEEVFFDDPALLGRLADAMLEAAADAETAAGWKWAAVMRDMDWSLTRGLGRVYPEEIELGEADQARWDEIEAALEDEDLDDAAYAALEAEREALQATMTVWSDAVKASAGVLVYIDADGAIAREYGLQRPEDVAPKAAGGGDNGGEAGAAEEIDDDGGAPGVSGGRVVLGATEPAAPPQPKRDPWSAALRDDLRQVLKGALQLAVAEDAAIALDLLHFTVVRAARSHWGYHEGVLDLRVVDATARLKDADGWRLREEALDIPATRVATAWEAADDEPGRFAAFRALAAADKAALVAGAVAQMTVAALPGEDSPELKPRTPMTAALAAAASPEVRRIWTPTAENFLGRVSKAMLLDIVEATLGADEARRSMGLRKADLVALLHAAFNDGEARRWDEATRQRLDFWLPEPIRLGGVGGPVGEGAGPDAEEDDAETPDDAMVSDADAMAAE